MALKKSELYASLWASCDELRGGMDASQYKDYVLVAAVHQVRQRQVRGPALRADHDSRRARASRTWSRSRASPTSATRSTRRSSRRWPTPTSCPTMPDFNDADEARQRQGDGGPAHQAHRHLREPGPRLLEEPRRGRRHPRRRLRVPDAALRHREWQEQGPVLHARRGQPRHGPDRRHPRTRRPAQRTTVYDPTCGSGSLLLKVGDEAAPPRSRSTARRRTPPPAASPG